MNRQGRQGRQDQYEIFGFRAEAESNRRDAEDTPEVEADDAVAQPDAVPLADWPGMGEVDGYWEVFDPYEDDKPVRASLSDDLRDVYRDVRAGGDHAIDALRALHRAVRR